VTHWLAEDAVVVAVEAAAVVVVAVFPAEAVVCPVVAAVVIAEEADTVVEVEATVEAVTVARHRCRARRLGHHRSAGRAEVMQARGPAMAICQHRGGDLVVGKAVVESPEADRVAVPARAISLEAGRAPDVRVPELGQALASFPQAATYKTF
jgi:hypothetical protein